MLFWIGFDLLYCHDISLDNFTQSTCFTFFGEGGREAANFGEVNPEPGGGEWKNLPLGSENE